MKKLLLLFTVFSISAADITLSWSPNPTMIEDAVQGYVLKHAGEDGIYTNLCSFTKESNACIVTNFNVGVHSFRLFCTNFVGVSDSFAQASTNLIWKPNAPSNVRIDKVTQKSVTMTFQLSP